MNTPLNLFIGAAPRSGTTQLVEALQAHPDVTITPESRFIQHFFSRGFPPDILLDAEQGALLESLMRADLKLSQWPNFELSPWLASQAPFEGRSISDVIGQLFLDYAQATGSGTRVLGDKRNLYTVGLGPYTREVFPQSRFIFMVRNPYDVLRSHEDLSDRALEPICHDLVYRYGNMKEMANRFPHAVRIQRYEELIDEPEQTLLELIRFLNLTPSDASLAALNEAVEATKAEGSPPDLSPDNERLVESITTPILDEQGYPTCD